jgi:hypothetical protein
MANMKKYTDEEQSIIKKQKAAIDRDQKTRFLKTHKGLV